MKVIPSLLSFSGEPRKAYVVDLLIKFGIFPIFSDFMIQNKIIILISLLVPVLYNLFKLWVEFKNGRKIRLILPNKIEIEATQLSEKQFLEFFFSDKGYYWQIRK